MFSKRSETSGIRGQLYETKLICLLYFRAFHDDTIEEFHIASNIDKIGAFDDICFKAKVKGFGKPVAVFIQAKHKENEKHTLKSDLAIYFDSYLKIREQFDPSNNDPFFNGSFDETECLFVIYTTAKDDFDDKLVDSGFHSNLFDLIDTEGTAKQPYNQEEDVEFLCGMIIKQQITCLAERIAKFMYDDKNFQMLLLDDLLYCYHVILAREVLDVSEIQPLQDNNGQRHRIASFRNDFFDNNEDYIVLFKDTLYLEVIKQRQIKPADIKLFLSEFLGDPTDLRLSKLIGTVITYNNKTGQLQFDKKSTKVFRPNMKPMDISRSTVNKAVELAARKILSPRTFKVPVMFGNKDLTISGNNDKIERRLNYITSKINNILVNCKATKIVKIDESWEAGLLQLNGGIAGAIGNIFVLDDNTKLMKITDNSDSLENLAQKLYQNLIAEIPDLLEYKFCVNINKFPKLLPESNEHEKNLARDFLNKLLFYSGQADENGVEGILKNDIVDYQQHHLNYFQAKTDAVFLEYHDKVQEWWMRTKEVEYLTRESDLIKKSINNIIKEPLMNSINVTYMSKMKNSKYAFTEDAVRFLNLQDQHSNTVILAENSMLTVMKVMQHLRKKEHIVLDIEYITKLPRNDRNALRTELANTNKVLIFVCDKIRNPRNEKKVLENIAEAVQKKTTIIITNNVVLKIIKEYFTNAENIARDERSSLLDMTEESQKFILENATVLFQDVEIKLNSIIDHKSMAFVKGDVLNKIINEETVVVGKLIISRSYDDIKHLYVDRRVKKTQYEDGKLVKTLNDIEDGVVLVTAEPGMGKTTLLTHLSIKTKEVKPQVWIVRINLLEYSREFNYWKKNETVIINTLETLKFMCQVILCDKFGKDYKIDIALEEVNDGVYLTHCTGDHWAEFELNLFLHLYNKNMVIFLFDGFDEICPHYANEVIKCINTVSNQKKHKKHTNKESDREYKHRKWITSRSYNEVKTILQREFGSAYEIDFFKNEEMEKYLEIFWDHHLRLEELNSEQLKNVKSFIEYMLDTENLALHKFAMPLHQVYNNAANYLINEIKFKCLPLWEYSKQFDDSIFIKEKDDCFIEKFYEDNSSGNPLHLYLTAVYFEDNIKSVNANTNKWNLEVNAFSFYERFMETKMKTIRFQEKNELNISKPDIMLTYDKELADFIMKHKQLAAYAIFHRQSHLLFSKKDFEEIIKTIRFIERGGEKTGLIYRVANDIPIFIHMTFTEYFAVEYICDCLKRENDCKKLVSWMDFIFNVMFSMDNLIYIRNIFDYRITIDSTLMRILKNNKDVIFVLIIEQGRVFSEIVASKRLNQFKAYDRDFWALSDALEQELHNFKSFFIEILECNLNENNLNDFLDIAKGSELLLTARRKSDVFLKFVIDVVRKIDESKLTIVLQNNFVFLSESTINRCVDMTSEEIVKLLLEEQISVDYHLPEQWSSSLSLPDSPPACQSDSAFNNLIYGLSNRIFKSSLPSGSGENSLSGGRSTPCSVKRLSSSSWPKLNLASSQFKRTFSLPSLHSASSLTSLTRHLSTSNLSRCLSEVSLPTRYSRPCLSSGSYENISQNNSDVCETDM